MMKRYTIETYGRRKASDVVIDEATLTEAIKRASDWINWLRSEGEFDVYVDIFETRDAIQVREGLMSPLRSFTS